jgi:nucleoside-triphosphatase THEP1
MYLAYVTTTERGATDLLLSAVAERLQTNGARLAGVVQTNTECADNSKCDMDVRVLPDGETIRISQSLGEHARGCRLDPAALEQAVGYVTNSLEDAPQLLIINKFGKHESDGRGFRPVIADALAQDIPVLVGVNGLNTEKFQEFTGGAAEQIAPSVEAVTEWFDRVTAQRAAAA